MMLKTIHAIVNPHAAHGLAGKKWPEVLAFLNSQGFDVIWQFTKKKYHACDIAQDFVKKGADTIVSIGGDGTFNEIVNGVLKCGSTVKKLPELAIIPIGTGADLAKGLNFPEDYKSAIEVIKNGKTKTIDIGEITLQTKNRRWQRYFANVFDAGLGGNVDRIANIMPKSIGGFLTFLFASLIAIITFQPIRLKVWIDDKFVEDASMPIIGAANGQFFGGDMHIAPMAKLDDGLFEIIYVKNTNMFKFLTKVLLPVYHAGHLKYRNVYHCRAKKLKIQCEKNYLMDIDGEVEKAKEVTVSIIPKAIKLRVPNHEAKPRDHEIE